MKIRVGIIGTGRLGQRYVSHLLQRNDVTIKAVCDVNHRAAAAAGHMSGAHVYTRFELVLLHEQLDALIVTSPARYHPLIIGDALEHGLDIFLSPPLAVSMPEARQLATKFRESGIRSALDYQLRYQPNLPIAHRLLARHPITKLVGYYRTPASPVNSRSSDTPPSPPPELLDAWELLTGPVRCVTPVPSDYSGTSLNLDGTTAGQVTGKRDLTTAWELSVDTPKANLTIDPTGMDVTLYNNTEHYTFDPMRALDTFLEALVLDDNGLIRTRPDTMLRPLALLLAVGEVVEKRETLLISDVLAREKPRPQSWPWRQFSRWLDFFWH